MRTKRMLWRLYPSYLLVIVLALIPVTWYATHSLRSYSLNQSARDLESRARLLIPLLQPLLPSADEPTIDSICVALGEKSGMRITVIKPDGHVLGDTKEDPAVMELHNARPEIVEALSGRVGQATRYSNTLQRNMLYVAVPVLEQNDIAGVVRVSLPVSTLKNEVSGLTRSVTIAGLIVAILAALVSLGISRSITRPLDELRAGADMFARGELNYTLPVSPHDEIGGLARAMNQMAAQLHDRIWTVVRQRNEQEAILTAMVEGVIAVDLHENILNLNRAAARLFRIKPEEARGRAIQEVVRNSDLHKLVSEALSSNEPVEGEIELTGAGSRQLQVHGTTLRDESGRSSGAVIVLNDITRIRKLENVRREFVANVSHELRTPITSIKGFLETLLDGALDSREDTERFVGIMLRHANQLNAIIEDLLALSRIEQGEGDGLEMTPQSVVRSLRNAVQTCSQRAFEKKITLTVENGDDHMAAINPTLFEQAIVNLLNNAITYSPSGSTVRVGARETDQGLDVYVSDDGPGIDARHLERLFERFYWVDNARSREGGGTGLGLAIVKHIALAHGGTVSVTSAIGAGSTFFVHLPAVPAHV